MRRRTLTGLAAGIALLPASGMSQRAADSDWPQRSVTFVVPFAAGGPADIAARVIAQGVQQITGKTAVVENRPGANGTLGARQIAAAAPDGSTLMVASLGVFALNALLRSNVGYDPFAYTPITNAVTLPNVLVVNPQLVPASDLRSLIAWMKERHGTVSYSTSGVGSSDHLTMELFKLLSGTDPSPVAYGGGSSATSDLVAGTVPLAFQNIGAVLGNVQGGRLRAIIVTGAERHPMLPDVPTAAEAGLNDFVVTTWMAVAGPPGMSPSLQAQISTIVTRALLLPASKERLEQAGLTVVANSPEEFAAFQRAEFARWRGVIQAAGIRPD